MGRAPCCSDHEGLKRGPWTAEEDQKLTHYVQGHGVGNWRTLPKLAGLSRCGKSCRLRWANYLRPDIKRGAFSAHEDLTIICLHAALGNKWSAIASNLPGRTDNEVKNHWNTKLKKRLLLMGIDPVTHMSLPTPDMLLSLMASSSTAMAARLNSALGEAQFGQLARDYVNITHPVSTGSDDEYSGQLSQILKLLGTNNNPEWAHPWGPLSSISTDQFLQPDALGCLHSMPNLVPSSNTTDKNDHVFYDSHQTSSCATSTNSDTGGSEILENTIHYHPEDTFGSAMGTPGPMSTADLQEDGSNYWVNLLNSVEDNSRDSVYMGLHILSP